MPGNPLTDPNWAPDLADQITTFIGKVRDNTTNNAIKAARGVVFGLLGAVLGLGMLISFLVAWAVIAVFLTYVQRHTLRVFAYYRIILGVLVMLVVR